MLLITKMEIPKLFNSTALRSVNLDLRWPLMMLESERYGS